MTNLQKFFWALAAVGILVGVPAFDIALRYIFRPAQEAVETATYNNTTSFINGKNSTIAKLKMDYQGETDLSKKNAIRAYVLAEAAEVDIKKLTEDNQEFINELKN